MFFAERIHGFFDGKNLFQFQISVYSVSEHEHCFFFFGKSISSDKTLIKIKSVGGAKGCCEFCEGEERV